MNEVKQASDAKVEQLTEDTIQDVSDEATGQIETITSDAVQQAAIDIRDSAINSLLPELEEIGISGADEAAQKIVDSSLGNLTLEPGEVADRALLESEISAVAGLALAEVPEELTASERQALEEATVNVLGASIADGVEMAKEDATENLPKDVKDEVNERPAGLLSSSEDVGLLSILGGVGTLALGSLLRFITTIVLRQPSSSANTAGAGKGQAGGAGL